MYNIIGIHAVKGTYFVEKFCEKIILVNILPFNAMAYKQ